MKIDIETLKRTKGIGVKTIERIKEQHDKDNNIKAFKSKYKPSNQYVIDNDITLWNGDCLELMHHIPDNSIDMVLCDLPYGTTACSWDEIIPFEPLWSHYKRIVKDSGAIVLFGNEPFSTKLRVSNLEWYKYEWIWKKSRKTGFALANKRPLKQFENILVYYKQQPIYNPQGIKKYEKPLIMKAHKNKGGDVYTSLDKPHTRYYYNYPTNILNFNNEGTNHHPTQKPVQLLEYLIKTYTDEGMLVLDNTMGSGSTGVAAKRTKRRFIGIEQDKEYYNIAKKRIKEEQANEKE